VAAWRFVLAGVAALAVAVPLAAAIGWINAAYPGNPGKAVSRIAVMFAMLAPLPIVGVVAVRRRETTRFEVGLAGLVTVGVLLAAIALHALWGTVTFPADFIVWSESEFVNDIIKLRAGYPLYTDQANNESFAYTPGSQLVTWILTSAVGAGSSVSAFRVVQLLFTLLAAVVGALCVREILVLAHPGRRTPRAAWGALWVPALLLIGSNAITNAYIVNLHNDGLAQLVSVVAFWLLLRYVATRDVRILALMAIVPAAGFAVKQSLVLWGGLYGAYLLFLDRPRCWKRVIGFGAASAALVVAAVGGGYALWGEPFIYWTFTVLGSHAVEPLRSIQHVLDAWVYFAAGIAAAVVLLRGPAFRVLIGPWLVWLLLLTTQAYTSGVAWMLNHMGPGSLVAGVWLLAAATELWERHAEAPAGTTAEQWMRPAAAMAIAVLLAAGLGVVRIPTPAFPADATRYVREIEREFDGLPASAVLLDAGSWMYMKDGVVMKDRATNIGERGYSQTGDFSGAIARIAERRYAKILARNYHSDDFWYDHAMWSRPSGIRRALAENYREVGTIAAVRGETGRGRYLFNEVTVLVPK
jgi:hypothetical protein